MRRLTSIRLWVIKELRKRSDKGSSLATGPQASAGPIEKFKSSPIIMFYLFDIDLERKSFRKFILP